MLGCGPPDRPLACTLYGVSGDSSRDDLAHVIDNLLCIVEFVHRYVCIAPGLDDADLDNCAHCDAAEYEWRPKFIINNIIANLTVQ